SLAKRYAWAAYLCGRLKQEREYDDYLAELKFSDTATTAALKWLELGSGLDWRTWQRKGCWSGQWLHWATPDQDPDEDPCPDKLWNLIQRHKAAHGKPPAYYAILMLDGDRLGELLRGSKDPKNPDDWGSGRARPENISRALTAFAIGEVETTVERD